jgi:hypothetical protein
MNKIRKNTMKTKTIVDALQTLSLIPSFSTSDFGGDVVPEAILIRNILEEMVASLYTLSILGTSIISNNLPFQNWCQNGMSSIGVAFLNSLMHCLAERPPKFFF